MTIHSKITATLTLLITMMAMSLTISTRASAYQCSVTNMAGQAKGATRAIARAKSRARWSKIVKNHLGQAWTLWSIASQKHTFCKKLQRTYNYKWKCYRQAKPCLLAVE